MLCMIFCAITIVYQFTELPCPLEPHMPDEYWQFMFNDNTSCAVDNITSYLDEKHQTHFSEVPELDFSDSKVQYLALARQNHLIFISVRTWTADWRFLPQNSNAKLWTGAGVILPGLSLRHSDDGLCFSMPCFCTADLRGAQAGFVENALSSNCCNQHCICFVLSRLLFWIPYVYECYRLGAFCNVFRYSRFITFWLCCLKDFRWMTRLHYLDESSFCAVLFWVRPCSTSRAAKRSSSEFGAARHYLAVLNFRWQNGFQQW